MIPVTEKCYFCRFAATIYELYQSVRINGKLTIEEIFITSFVEPSDYINIQRSVWNH